MKSPKTGNDSLMVIWTTMILAVLEKEKRFSLYKEKCNMKKISLLFCLIILQAGLLCGCRLPHKSSPQKPVEGENKSGLVKVQDDKKEEKKEEKEKEKEEPGKTEIVETEDTELSIKTAAVQGLHFSGMWTVNLQGQIFHFTWNFII